MMFSFFKHPNFSGSNEFVILLSIHNINKFPTNFGLVFIFITILAVDALAGGWAYVIGIPMKGMKSLWVETWKQ